jgi:hypothetical protein
MSSTSSIIKPSGAIFQIMAGRWETANFKDHSGDVFNRLSRHDFTYLTKLGVSAVYLTGVFDNRGPVIVREEAGKNLDGHPDRIPSMFALTDHLNPHPGLGSLPALKELIQSVHRQSLDLYLDFIPNHTGTAHPWVADHPAYYHRHQGNFTAEFSGDVYKLNYGNKQLREQMLNIMLTLASWGIDGLRCDMAHLVPADFWQDSIALVKAKYPQFYFLGEVYPENIFNLSIFERFFKLGFDGLYHGPLYNNLHSLITQQTPVNYLTDHINYIIQQFPAAGFVNYLANHDDPPADNLSDYLEAVIALILFLPGRPLIYNGLLQHFNRRLAHHYLDILPKNYLDRNHIGQNIIDLLSYFALNHPLIRSVTVLPNQLIEAGLATLQGPATMLINLSAKPAYLKNQNLIKPGLLHGSMAKDLLFPGKAEIFPFTITPSP